MGLSSLFLILSLLSTMAFANPEKEKIYSLLTTLPKVTKAKIKRGNTEIPVDFSDASANSKIKDFDVIILDEGVYSTLGDFTAKYVRVRGQGQRKTVISSFTKSSSPILVNSTEFWDLSIVDAQFKVSDLNGLWAVNVEFAGSILVKPAAMDKSPAFAIRTVFSDITNSDLPTVDDDLHSHFLTKQDEKYLMPLPGDYKELKESHTPANLLAYEDHFDRTENINLKNRIGYKGLFARGLNYLYQKEVLKPHYDHAKYKLLAQNARATKAKGHLYVSMLYWAEADRLSGHSHFDEVLKEISPLNQSLSQDCGCTVEGQGLASTLKNEIEQKLYTKLPITALPGRCKIQTLHVNVPAGAKKESIIAAARQQNQQELAIAYRTSEDSFQKSIIAHAENPKGTSGEEEMLLGAEAPVTPKDYTAVADVEMPGIKKSYTTDIKISKNNESNSIDQNIIDPIARIFIKKFASNIKAAKAKIASSDLALKIDGLIAQALYGEELRDKEYENIHEQQFGRKVSSAGAMSSVFAY
jgi:hypothetical protein